MTLSKTAIILLHYEDYARKHFDAWYESFLAQERAGRQVTLFMVSNGASVDFRDKVSGREVRFIDLKKNHGWAGGNNAAARIAVEEGYDNIILLNMDTILDGRWLKELVEYAESRPREHIIQSRIMLHGTNRINSIGNRTHFLGYGFCHGYGREESEALPSIDFASGASMLVKSEVFRKIGYFNERYFLYYDDMEFCWRARLAGFRIGLAEKSVCYHKYDFSGKLRHLYQLERNRLLTLLTLQKKRTLALILAPLAAAQAVSAVYFIHKGHGAAVRKLVSFFLRSDTWHFIAAARRKNRLLRAVKDRELLRFFSGDIVFAEIKNPLLCRFINPLLWLYWNLIRRVIFW